MKRRTLLQLAAGMPLFAQTPKPAPKTEWIAWIGTYTNRNKSKGIYAYRWMPGEKKFTSIGLAAETASPSFLAVHPNQRYLYAVNETDTGSVSAFAIEPAAGTLKALNHVSSHGSGPCHLVVERNGRWVYVANYNSGSIAALPIQQDGSLGEATAFAQHTGSSINQSRQKSPHAHMAALSPDNRFVLFADLGLDQVLIYPIDPDSGGLNTRDVETVKLPPGSGPRHIAFRGDGKYVYVLNEIIPSITTFRYSPQRPTLDEPQTVSTLPDGYNGTKSGAEIVVRGNHVYASNRGHDSIAVFRSDAGTGKLTLVGHTPTQGKTPRNFAIDPTGNYLLAANQDSDNVVLFKLNSGAGTLSPAGDTWSVGSPVCVVFSSVK